MKIDRGRLDSGDRPSERAALAGLPGHSPVATASFAAALNQHRRRDAAPREGAQRPADEPARKPARPAARTDSSRSAASGSAATLVDVSQGPAFDLPGMLAQLSTCGENAAHSHAQPQAHALTHSQASTMSAHETRRRRFIESLNTSPCIEIAHSRTGTRFVLSRNDGVWLLSLQGKPSAHGAEIQSSIEALRAQFAKLGLGPLDVILNDE